MKINNVFQTGFDIGESAESTKQDRINLFKQIETLINNTKGFKCLNGIFMTEDVTKFYPLDEINGK